MLKASLRLLLPIGLLLILQIPVLTQDIENDPARKLFSEGLVLLREGKFEDALAAFEKSAAISPNQPATFGNIGTAALRLGKLEKAEFALRKAIDLQPGQSGFHANLCEALGRQKKFSEAIEACNEGVRLNPTGEMENASRLTEYFQAGRPDDLRQGNYARAVVILESLVRLRPSASRYHGMLAHAYVRLERDADALAAARTALQIDPQDSFANFAMGSIFFELGQHVEAIESFSRVSPDHPHSDLARFQHALSEIRRGRHAVEAGKHFDVAFKLDPAADEVYHLIGIAYSEMGLQEEAVAAYQKAIEKGDNPGSHFALAGIYAKLGDFERASTFYRKGIEIKPDTPSYIKRFGDLLLDNGNRREALEMYKRSLAIRPNEPGVIFDTAVLSLKLGEKDAALTYFTILRSIAPNRERLLEQCFLIWG
ncbi:MAG: tetratricopeptide repeat protein [Blastocatellia bacterium]|nr:tetratricopeptide repeat protein [Blastocatellia bacterium]